MTHKQTSGAYAAVKAALIHLGKATRHQIREAIPYVPAEKVAKCLGKTRSGWSGPMAVGRVNEVLPSGRRQSSVVYQWVHVSQHKPEGKQRKVSAKRQAARAAAQKPVVFEMPEPPMPADCPYERGHFTALARQASAELPYGFPPKYWSVTR